METAPVSSRPCAPKSPAPTRPKLSLSRGSNPTCCCSTTCCLHMAESHLDRHAKLSLRWLIRQGCKCIKEDDLMSKSSAPTFVSARAAGVSPVRVKIGRADLTATSYLNERQFPLVVTPAIEGVSLPAWAAENRDWIDRQLLLHGAILFRGFNVESVERFRAFAAAVSNELLDYRERAAPRVQVAERAFTSSEYPANQVIHLHHEMSYSHNWPSKVLFQCRTPATEGGRTPIARERDVFPAIDADVREQFRTKGVMYVRNFGPELDLSWPEAFQTNDPQAVEQYCRRSDIRFEWRVRERWSDARQYCSTACGSFVVLPAVKHPVRMARSGAVAHRAGAAGSGATS